MRLPKGGKKSSADQQLPTSSTADLATLGPRRSGQCLRSPAPGCGPWICGQLRTVGKAHVPADSRKRINPERYVTSLGALVLRPRLLQGSPTSKNDECRTSLDTLTMLHPTQTSQSTTKSKSRPVILTGSNSCTCSSVCSFRFTCISAFLMHPANVPKLCPHQGTAQPKLSPQGTIARAICA